MKRCATNVSLVDIFNTVLECVGLQDSNDSLWKLAKCPDKNRFVFSEFHACGAIEDIYMIRGPRYKYIYYHNYQPQLFDLRNDPYELADISNDPASCSIIKEHKDQLLKIVDPAEIDKLCRADQEKKLALFGGRDDLSGAVIWTASETPVPKGFTNT